MTNHSDRVNHNIYGMRLMPLDRENLTLAAGFHRHEQSGYALVALLAMMTLLTLFALAAAPRIRQQNQREREKEAIFRGEQVADAIRTYFSYRVTQMRVGGDQALPSSIDQLLEGLPIQGGSKKRQILRPSAVHDPLSTTGEWRLIKPRSPELIDFQQAVITFAGNQLPTPRDQQMVALQQLAVPQLTAILNTGIREPASSGEESSDSYTGPFVGVSSRSKNSSVLYYYDIDHHNQWIFTPLFR